MNTQRCHYPNTRPFFSRGAPRPGGACWGPRFRAGLCSGTL